MNSKILFLVPGLLCLCLKANTGLNYDFSSLNPCRTINPSKNPALCVMFNKPFLLFSASNLYTLKGLNETEIYSAVPYKHWATEFSFNSFGNGIYKRNRFGIGVSGRLNQGLCIGLRANYISSGISHYGSLRVFSLDAALFAGISKTISTSVSINALKPLSGTEEINKALPGSFNWAVIINSGQSLKLCFEIGKSAYNYTEISCNVNYCRDSSIQLNLNFGNKFREIGFGIWYHKNKTTIGSGFRFHVLLGISSNINMIYEFKT